MSKKFFGFLVSGLLVLAFVCGGIQPAAAEPIKLTYSNFFPPTHVQSKLAEEWSKEVEKRTDGRVVVEYFPGQTLTKGNVVYDGVVNGLSDIGLSVLGYTRGRFPVMEVTDLPLGQGTGVVATQVANEVYNLLQPKELSDTKVMYLHAHGPGLLHTAKKAVRKLEDIKGLKIRCHGTSLKIVEALGGTPVAKPMPESYQLLQKGVVDGAMYPLESNKGWKLGEVIDYVTMAYSAAYTTTFFVVMNKDKWALISPEDQKTIEQLNLEWAEKTGKAWDEIDQEGLNYLKEQKVELIELDEAESKRWAEASQPVLDAFVKSANEQGLEGAKALEAAQAAVKKFAPAK